MTTMTFVSDRHDYAHGAGWSRRVLVGDVEYVVGVERGRKVRIAFKPSGQNVGWRYHGFVRDVRGREVWSERVGGTLGARGLLRRAGLLPPTGSDTKETL